MKTTYQRLIAINIAALMVLMDLSAVNLALPSIREYFQLTVFQVSLVLMSSMLTATGFALIMGKLIETQKPGRILNISFFVFAFTSGLSSICTHFSLLLLLRFIQGVAEAGLYVMGPAIIKKYIADNGQQKEYGHWMMSCGLGISIGPLIAAIILQYFTWNAVFLINVPLAAIGMLFSWNMDKNLKFEKYRSAFDYLGALFSFLFLAFVIITFNMISFFGLSSPWVWSLVAVSFTFLYLFIKRESHFNKPLVNLQLFTINNFRLANLGFYLFFLINVGSRFLRPFYFKEARGLSYHETGLLMMISPAVMLIVSAFIHKLEKHFTTRQLHIIGNIFLSLSMLMFSFWNSQQHILFIIFSMIVLGLAMGIYYPVTTQLGMTSLPDGSHGGGSALISISKSFGKLMGILLFGLVFQFFLQNISVKTSPDIPTKTTAIQYVFRSAFVLSLLNMLLSFLTKRKA